MKAHHPHSRKGRLLGHKKETHILSTVAAVLAFAVVYICADNAKFYYAAAGAVGMAGAIYFANYLQFHRKANGWIK